MEVETKKETETEKKERKKNAETDGRQRIEIGNSILYSVGRNRITNESLITIQIRFITFSSNRKFVRQTVGLTDSQTYMVHVDRQTCLQADIHTDRKTDQQIVRHIK